MIITNAVTLSSVLKQIDSRPSPFIGVNELEAIANQLSYAEGILKDLQQLKDSLICAQIVSKADALALIKTIRKLYTHLDVYHEIESVWPFVRNALNNSLVTFSGQDLYERLLLNKNIIVQNRMLFAARKRLAELRTNKAKNPQFHKHTRGYTNG